VGDVFDAAGEPKRRVLLRVFKGDGRGEDDLQEVVLSEALRAKLAGLRAWKQAERESLAHDAPLFVSQRGLRLSTRQLRHAFGIWQVRAGFERHVSAHSLRHSACTNIDRWTTTVRVVSTCGQRLGAGRAGTRDLPLAERRRPSRART